TIVHDINGQGHNILRPRAGDPQYGGKVVESLDGLGVQVICPDQLPDTVPRQLRGDVDGAADAYDLRPKLGIRDSRSARKRLGLRHSSPSHPAHSHTTAAVPRFTPAQRRFAVAIIRGPILIVPPAAIRFHLIATQE